MTLFNGPKLKIERGRRHLNELAEEISSYLKRDPWVVVLQFNEETNKHQVALLGREEIPDNFSVIFGDAVHNFRCALDILANDVVRLGGIEPDKVYFPFGKSEPDFEAMLKRRFYQAPIEIQEIVRSYKPYPGDSNNILRAMHDLDIGDKHIAIMQASTGGATPSLPIRQVSHERIAGERPNRLTFQADFRALPTTPVDLHGFPTFPSVKTIGKVNGSVVKLEIAKPLPLAGTEALVALKQIGDIAETIIQKFEAHFSQ
jgi:hypothetical protein